MYENAMLFSGVAVLLGAAVLYSLLLMTYRLWLHPLARFPGPRLAAVTGWYEFYFDILNGDKYTFMHEIERMHDIYGPIVRINPCEIHVKDPTWYDTLYAGPAQTRDKYAPAASTVGAPLGSKYNLNWTPTFMYRRLKASRKFQVFGTLPHRIHVKRRGAINSFLSKRAITANESVIHERTGRLCEALQNQFDRFGVVELRVNYLAFATDAIFTFTYNGSLDLLGNLAEATEWKHTIGAIAGLTPLIKQFPWILPLARRLPLLFWQFVLPELGRALVLHKDTERRAAEVLKIYDGGSDKDPYLDSKAAQGGRSPTIYHEVLNSKLPAEEKRLDRLAQEAFTLVVAGGETTARTMTVATYYILATEGVLPRLRTELEEIMPDPHSTIEANRLEKLPWLTAVIKESLRIGENITTRLPLISPIKPLYYQDWEIPPGTPVSLSHGKTLLDPSVYKDPMSFIPERWLPDNPDYERISRLFVPFGKGNRGCYGQQ
ncbi:hypothetical protein MMC27_008375 [Xylographa pallens]|nr:hypothetical protein [Xylographa pallens]